MLTKPTKHLDWAIAPPAGGVVEPGQAKKEFGWIADERPPAEFWNYNLNLVDQWLKYLEQEIGTAVASWDAVVSTQPFGTHASLAAVMADGTVPSGARVLILEDETINTAIIINKTEVELYFGPSVTYTKGTDTIGLSIQAPGVKVINGKFQGFTTAGDKAIDMNGLADYCWFERCRFAVNTDTEIDTSSVNPGKEPRIMTFSET